MEIRICKICLIEKPMTSFPQRTPSKTDLRVYRRHQCNTCISRKYKATPLGRIKIRNNAKKYQQKYKDQVPQIKAKLFEDINQTKCKHCSFEKQEAFCFHHREPKTKEFGIAWALRHQYCYETILTEAKKCDILCQNCHTKVHYKGTSNRAKICIKNKIQLMQDIGQTYCKHCQVNDPVVLCFHHKDPKTKIFKLANKLGYTDLYSVLLEEAKKCDVLCMNCHTIFHLTE